MPVPKDSNASQFDYFDIAIVGGGLVGASLGLLLRPLIQKGLRVALVDAQAVEPEHLLQPSFDARTSALSLGTQRLLASLQVWPSIAPDACPIEHIQVSQQGQFGRVHLHHHEMKVPALGYVIENRLLGQGLWKNLQSEEKFHIIAPATVQQVSTNEHGAQITLTQPSDSEATTRVIQAELLVLADGANSLGCRSLGIEQRKQSYHQQAIVANIAFDQPHQQWAYERFTQQGPLALLPLTGNRFGLVWCASPDEAEHLMQLPETAFQQALQKAIGYRRGRIQRIGQRQTYPLSLVQSHEQVRRHVAVLGNAAHALHPVAGQGFNLALRDAKALSDHLERAFEKGQALGDISVLTSYHQAQQTDQNLTIGLSHWLPTLFTQPGSAWSLARAAAMTSLDCMPIAKTLFARQAMGLVGTPETWRP